jgi:hypothetical protein
MQWGVICSTVYCPCSYMVGREGESE